jgi:hypothetical protein
VQKPGYYAIRDRLENEQRQTEENSEAIMQFPEEAIVVFEGAPPARRSGEETVSPVYALQPGDGLAVPTGQVFIRFAEGDRVEAHRAELEQAGYEIVEILDYAPQAAWLRPQSGQIAAGLNNLERLTAIANVERVEPQLLMERGKR